MVFEPSKSLNIITGETGAGKSIILDALGLILGNRADIKTTLPHNSAKETKCIVEGVFSLDKLKYQSIFEMLELDFEEETIIRREISENGKSRSFINDTPVNLLQIKAITDSLVSIHSQHENSQLTEKFFQFNMIDAFAKHLPEVAIFQNEYSILKELTIALNSLKDKQQNFLKEKDYLSFLLTEFENANLQSNEEELLENEFNLLSNAETIETVASSLMQTLTDGDGSIVDSLSQLKTQLKSIANAGKLSNEILMRVESVIIELKDIAGEAENLKESAIPDPQRLNEVNLRLQLIQNLCRKHGVLNGNDLLIEQQLLSEKLNTIGNIDKEIEVLENTLNLKDKYLNELAEKLHYSRLAIVDTMENEIRKLLSNLEMPKAEIKLEMNLKNYFDEFGKTDLNILFSANVGMPLQLLSKVASGGELSRLALCFRSIEADYADLNTLIFDEIDTGVSGKVADTIGSLFEKLASKHQIIAITHLPQVASYGKAHFMLGKKEENNKTVSYIKRLDQSERVIELAKMLSGNAATEIAKKNALELLKN